MYTSILSLVGAAFLILCPLLARADSTVEFGLRLYRDGIGVDGRPVTAVVQGDVPVDGRQVVCVGCHKRSGLGTSEGGSRAPDITGRALFGVPEERPQGLQKVRRPYDDASVSRVVVAGTDPEGRALDALMPRYRLGESDVAALTAYLRTLGTEPPIGVDANDIELVTVVAADADPREREAVAAVVQRFATFRNGVTRHERKRADASRRHPYGERQARAFRNWHVSVWMLDGKPADWPEQLEALYAQRPPFAVISGAVGDEWSVVDEFCERKELPCVLPVTDLPRAVTGSFFNLHFSDGVRLDARVTGSSLQQGDGPSAGRVLLVHTDDARGHAARDALLASWSDSQRRSFESVAIETSATPPPDYWQTLLTRERPDVLVAWIGPAQMQSLIDAGTRMPSLPSRIYTADSFTDWTTLYAPPAFERRVLHVYPYSLPSPDGAQFPRERAWLRSQGFDHLDRRAAAKALFACHAVGEAIVGMAGNYSREYLVETLEHMLDGSNMTMLYPVTTLGTGQRELVKGAYVARLAGTGSAQRYVSSNWILP